ERVLRELKRVTATGRSTAYGDLMKAGRTDLIGAAISYAGGLANARKAAGLPQLVRRRSNRTWTKERVVRELEKRVREGRSLVPRDVPTKLLTAGRWHFSKWRIALAAVGASYEPIRANSRKYTKEAIVKRLRREAAKGSDLREKSLLKVLKMEAVRREFGSLREALIAAGLGEQLARRKHGGLKWSRERVIAELQARAMRGEHVLPSRLHRVVQAYFGGVEGARRAAGVPSPIDLRIEERRQMKRGKSRTAGSRKGRTARSRAR
ncbi:MAG: hypothetical protein ABI678_29500, partial [Kofleriaceae bacterium]